MQATYIHDNLAPVQVEHTAVDLAVTGDIPSHLQGRYVRVGSNPIGALDPARYHWFTGDGMVHGVALRGGRATWYRNRWVRNPRVAAELHEPHRRQRSHGGFDYVAANTNVISHAGRTLALIEGGVVSYELGHELETIGPFDFGGTVRGGYTAHPKLDPVTRELHGVSYSFARGNTVQYTAIDAGGRSRRTVDIEVDGSPMIHDMSITERFAVIYDLPVCFDASLAADAFRVPAFTERGTVRALDAVVGHRRIPEALARLAAARLQPNGPVPYRWDPSRPARVGLLPREGTGSDVRWFEVSPCFVFHPLNAYDDGDHVVLDVVRHPKMFDTDLRGPDEGPSTLDRWTIDLLAGTVREERLDDHPQEFPRIDDRRVGRSYRYGYAMGVDHGIVGSDLLLKHDLVGGTTRVRAFGAGQEIGEFVFVPNDPTAAEDDGILMGFVYDATTGRSDLALVDADTLEPVAVVHLPARVPTGFHGNWLPDR